MRVTNEQARSAIKADHITGNTTTIIKGYAVDLLEARELIKEMRAFCKDVADNYDCDSDAHKYNTGCRSCNAKAMIEKSKEYAE